MSIYVTTTVWKYSRHSGSALLTMLAIADFADDNGEAFPGQDTLAKKARTTIRNIQKILDKLVESGELSIDHKNGIKTGSGQFTNRYKIQLHALQSGEPQYGSLSTKDTNHSTGLKNKDTNAGTGADTNASTGADSEDLSPSSYKPSVKEESSEESSEKDSPHTPQGDRRALDLELMQDAVKLHLKLYGDRQRNVAMLLLNQHTGANKKHNIGGPPATPDELATFVADWKRLKPTLDPPLKIESVCQWFNRWREDRFGAPQPAARTASHEEWVKRLGQSKYAEFYANADHFVPVGT